MLNKDLAVKITLGYTDLVETKDPKVCAAVLALVMEHEGENPETPEQRLVRELEDKAATADSRAYDQKIRADRLEKQVAELTKKLQDLTAAFFTPKAPATEVL